MVTHGFLMSDSRAHGCRIRGIPRWHPLSRRRSVRLYGPRFLGDPRPEQGGCMNLLVAQRRLIAERGVAPPRVVPAFDVVEDRELGRGACHEPASIEQLTLESREEALAQGVVVRIAHRAVDGWTPASRQRSPKDGPSTRSTSTWMTGSPASSSARAGQDSPACSTRYPLTRRSRCWL